MVGRSCAPRGRPPVIVPARPATARRTAGPARRVGRTCPSADGRSAPLPLSENDGGGPGASTDNSGSGMEPATPLGGGHVEPGTGVHGGLWKRAFPVEPPPI